MADNVYISTDKEKVDLRFVHQYLSEEAYWSKGIPFETLKRSVENSLNFSLFLDSKQVAYARVITDYATIAYLGDVFVSPPHRGRGFSKLLMEYITAFPCLVGLRRWILITGDAHGLYEQFGWKLLDQPAKWMEINNKNPYPLTQ